MRAAEAQQAEARAADPLWPWSQPTSALRRLAGESTWDDSGTVAVTGTHLVFDGGGRQRKTALRTVRTVERLEATLWVRRRNAHDWLVRFDRERDARRAEVALRRAVAKRIRPR